VILDSNPAYTAPVDLKFAAALAQVPFSVHLGGYEDETAALCRWHLPQTHFLEAWGDARAYDGTLSLIQPLIAPLYDTRTAHEVVAVLSEELARSNHDIVQGYWQKHPNHTGTDDFRAFWRGALNDGVVPDSAAPTQTVTLAANFNSTPTVTAPTVIAPTVAPPTPDAGTLELQFCPDPKVWDGRYANNGWLQELPEPLNKLTWDNAALVSPRTAQDLHLADGEEVEVRSHGNSLLAPILILPGHPDAAVTLALGYGRTRVGSVGAGVGSNAYLLRTSDAPWFGGGCELHRTGRTLPLAITHSHHTMEGRDIVRAGTLTQFRRDPDFVHRAPDSEERPPSLYPDWHYPEYAWAMSIDLSVCIGCNACVLACQAENNIAIVGKSEVLRGREMHWIRIDRYYEGKDLDHPTATYFMPIPCMQCEHAPCELVCPPGATMHNRDGLNQMVYNRCIGTRYCSNNCPYKVRRFNFLPYSDQAPLIQLMRNPEVTVRTRGVMEKCTYCVQRIENAKIAADKEDRLVRDGEVVTACAQACPTQAIVFGNLADRESRVSRLKQEPHNYGLLAELDTRPRTTYLARITDPNPRLSAE
jgi:molybdopterin-containing oxidoreductase family iron-sulfur binding subunit